MLLRNHGQNLIFRENENTDQFLSHRQVVHNQLKVEDETNRHGHRLSGSRIGAFAI